MILTQWSRQGDKTRGFQTLMLPQQAPYTKESVKLCAMPGGSLSVLMFGLNKEKKRKAGGDNGMGWDWRLEPAVSRPSPPSGHCTCSVIHQSGDHHLPGFDNIPKGRSAEHRLGQR
ncbi:hypothetical protein J3F84DRAFT_390024 [Trichoderma pleuroticola]